MPFNEDFDHLLFDIKYALSQSKCLKPSRHGDVHLSTLAAEKVIAHLKLCGWRFEKGPAEHGPKPVAKPHST